MIHPLVYPMAAMIFLTFCFALFMLFTRIREVRAGKVRVSYFKTFSGETPSDIILKTNRHFANLFEVPVLFYATILLCIQMNLTSFGLLVLAWLFVLSRLTHAISHVFIDNIYPRMISFIIGFISVIAMWFFILAG